MAGRESGSATSQSGSSLGDVPSTASQTVASGGKGEISPTLATLVAQSVQAALAAERAAHCSPQC